MSNEAPDEHGLENLFHPVDDVDDEVEDHVVMFESSECFCFVVLSHCCHNLFDSQLLTLESC